MLFGIAWTTTLFLFPIARWSVTLRTLDCPQTVFKNCSCYLYGITGTIRLYNCSNRDFVKIPSFLNRQRPEEILLNGNKINECPNFAVFPDSLKKLNLSHNRLRNFSRHVFDELKNLKVLDISNNVLFSEVSSFPMGTFRNLRNLKQLNIQMNIGENVAHYINHTDAFADLINLEVLKSDAYVTPIFSPGFRNLTKLIRLELSGSSGYCNLNSLNSSAFANLPYIEELVLNNCQIKEIHNGTFRNLKFLTDLDISFNMELTFEVFPNISSDLLYTNVKTLKANKLHCTFGIGKKVSKYQLNNLKHTKIRNIYLDHNKIEVFEFGTLSMLPRNLSFISLRSNRLIFDKCLLNVVSLENLQELDGSLQHFQYDPNDYSDFLYCDDTKTICPQYHSRNNGSMILKLPPYELEFHLPMRLKKLMLPRSSISFDYIGIWRLNRNNSLEHVDISGNRISNIHGPLIGLTKLKHANLSQIQCSAFDSYFFIDLKQLEVLDMHGNSLGETLRKEYNGTLFSFLPNLKVLNLSTNGINDLPKNIFRGLFGLETLVLRKNSIKILNANVRNMKNLSFIDLSENSISELSSPFMNDFDYLTRRRKVYLSLNLNPLRCTCSTMKMLYWLKKMEHSILDFRKLTCFYEENSILKGLLDLDEIIRTLEKECNSYLGIIFGISSLIVFVIAIIVSVIIYRYRWKIRYFFYISRNKYKKYHNYIEEDHISRFRYDAFVSYSDENKEFVIEKMIKELEEVSDFRLCLSGRDFRPGASIAENITRAINKSKKTIVVMSVDYLLSYWCMYELNMARMEGLYSRSDQDVLLMIVLQKVAFQNAPHVVLELINNNSFLEYPDDQHGKVVFWEKLREALA